MIHKLVCSLFGHDLDRQLYDIRYSAETRVIQWRTRLSCRRCRWNDVRLLGASSIEPDRRSAR